MRALGKEKKGRREKPACLYPENRQKRSAAAVKGRNQGKCKKNSNCPFRNPAGPPPRSAESLSGKKAGKI